MRHTSRRPAQTLLRSTRAVVRKALSRASRRGSRSRGTAAAGKPRRADYNDVLRDLLSLTPHKQSLVFESWPGVAGITPEGLQVTGRSAKELRRFTNARDEGMLRWIRSFQEGDVFYDIGANVGGMTLSVAGIHGTTVQIVAIEPSYASFESLARNLSANGLLSTTIPLQVALLDSTGLQTLNYRSTAAGTALHAVGTAADHLGEEFTPVEVQHVPTFRLDDLIRILDLPAPTVVKIDIDGDEEAVLRGSTETLRAGTVRELVVEVVDHDRLGTRLKAIGALLESCGYWPNDAFEHGDGSGFVSDHLFRRRPPGEDPDGGSAVVPSGGTSTT